MPRTGAPEVATDPMGIEQSDVYITLKPRDEWRPGLTKAALGREIAEVVESEVPEVAVAVSQPIQMRTNELIAGVRSDVAAQIYGPDLDDAAAGRRQQVAAALRGVPGAVDVRVEQVAGLTYLRIRPDRARLARYGLTVEDVNTVTETMAVGRTVGRGLREGSALRPWSCGRALDYQGSLDVVRALPLKSALGQIVPLGDVADVALETGPAQVSRDKQSRRLAGRVQRARSRRRSRWSRTRAPRSPRRCSCRRATASSGAVSSRTTRPRARAWPSSCPLALGLIVFLLWLAFGTVKPALLIFANVPFAVVGGVVALWLRGIPFCISAGVGFIALFGVAVLNGLVLVSFCRQLQEEGTSPAEAIAQAAELRLRPVLMTALVAALGFVPMALSRAPGSEVQRPLATVVIGGLITATALTLLLFPAVYALAPPPPGLRWPRRSWEPVARVLTERK